MHARILIHFAWMLLNVHSHAYTHTHMLYPSLCDIYFCGLFYFDFCILIFPFKLNMNSTGECVSLGVVIVIVFFFCVHFVHIFIRVFHSFHNLYAYKSIIARIIHNWTGEKQNVRERESEKNQWNWIFKWVHVDVLLWSNMWRHTNVRNFWTDKKQQPKTKQ